MIILDNYLDSHQNKRTSEENLIIRNYLNLKITDIIKNAKM